MGKRAIHHAPILDGINDTAKVIETVWELEKSVL